MSPALYSYPNVARPRKDSCRECRLAGLEETDIWTLRGFQKRSTKPVDSRRLFSEFCSDRTQQATENRV